MPEWRKEWEVQPLDVPDSKWCSNRKGLRVGSQSLLRHLGLVAQRKSTALIMRRLGFRNSPGPHY
jgi:hypothetical protein